MSDDEIKFKEVEKSDIKFLYQHLKERDPKENISHQQMPTYTEHVKFVLSSPYYKWYIILQKNKKIGTIYLTHDDEIGLHLKKEWFNNAILEETFEILKKTIPQKRYVVNISPKNLKLKNFFLKKGFFMSQQTFVKYH